MGQRSTNLTLLDRRHRPLCRGYKYFLALCIEEGIHTPSICPEYQIHIQSVIPKRRKCHMTRPKCRPFSMLNLSISNCSNPTSTLSFTKLSSYLMPQIDFGRREMTMCIKQKSKLGHTKFSKTVPECCGHSAGVTNVQSC